MVRTGRFQKKTWIKLLTLILLACSAVLALVDLGACLKIFSFIFTVLFQDAQTAAAMTAPLTFVLGFSALAFLVYTGEYHWRRLGSAVSRKLFRYTFCAQIALGLLGLLLAGWKI